MYGTLRIKIKRTGDVVICGNKSYQRIGYATKSANGSYRFCMCNGRFIGTAKGLIDLKIMAFKAGQESDEFMAGERFRINDKAVIITK